MEELKEYCEREEISEKGKEELILLMNKMIEKRERENIREIIKKTVEETIRMKKEKERKRYKSRKAEELAEEHEIEISEFEMEEISKKDVENKIKEKTKNKNENEINSEKKIEKRIEGKRKVICSGINKKGEACKSTGTIKPDGSKKHYCFRHAEDWKSFECSSDSSEDELEKEEVIDSK